MSSNPEQPDCYHALAPLYDRLMSGTKYQRWETLIGEVVRGYGVPSGYCLDLACGTGKITEMVKRLGFEAVGVDRSAEMLAVARKRLPDTLFVEADLRDYSVPCPRERVVMAVSFYDSLNYLTCEDDLLAAFQAAARALTDGAIFLFDMNTREHVRLMQQAKPRVFDEQDYFAVFRFGGEGRLWQLDMDLFVPENASDTVRAYSRHQERHLECGYDEADVAPLLDRAGFDLLEVRQENKLYEDGLEHPSRLYFVARRRVTL